MPTALGRLRARVLTPSVTATSLDERGFHRKSPEAQELLETVGRRFLEGYGHAVGARSTTEAEDRLEAIEQRFRGFAYEGAGMGAAMLDGLPGLGRGHVDRLLAGRGGPHEYMVYVGVGWAMARLPRACWPDVGALDPLLRWLVLDGYGFHQAYFRTERYVGGQYRDPRFPWPAHDHPDYAANAVDQGVGRALWFVCGTDADLVATAVAQFPASRRRDLYSGVGLAATYAGGCTERELTVLRERGGEHRGALAQGSAFAAEARLRAGLHVAHTALATRVLCGMEPEEAAAVTQEVRPRGTSAGPLPAYEVWRRAIAARITGATEPR
ncbi:DUF1702 family protein [Streptomyces sp. NPDC046985]|uniref:DUF1702 family protein n=1 Tax=Streptomyces sp. NPDC046985 TaxID=3155377 RepID=UPI0033F85BBF